MVIAASTNFWNQLLTFASLREIPTRQEFVTGLLELGALQSLLLFAVGIVYLLAGWQAFKVLIIANAVVLGALGGAMIGGWLNGQSMQIVGAIAGGLLLGTLAWPLMKYAVGLMGAMAGSFIGYGLWKYVAIISGSAAMGNYAWAGALIGLVALGLLAFVIFRETIIVFTSFEGAMLAVSGALAILLKFHSLSNPLQHSLIHNLHLVPVLVAVPAIIGIAFQHAGTSKKKKKKSKPAIV